MEIAAAWLKAHLVEIMCEEMLKILEAGPPVFLGADYGREEIPILDRGDIYKIQEPLPDLGRPRRDWEDRQYRRPRGKRR